MVDVVKRIVNHENTINESFNNLIENADKESYDKFMEHCDHVIRYINRLFGSYMPPQIKLKLESIMHRILFKKINLQEKHSNENVIFQPIHSLFKNRLNTGIVINLKHSDPINFINDSKKSIFKFIQNLVNEQKSIKANVTFCGKFELNDNIEEKYFSIKYKEFYLTTDLESWYNHVVKEPLLKQIEDFELSVGSGWKFRECKYITINILKHNPFTIGHLIKPPKWITKSTSVINVNTTGNDCFKLCLLAALCFPANTRNPQRPTKIRKVEREFNFDGIDFPVKLSDVKKFERKNKISINVFEPLGKSIVPVHLCKTEFKEHVNLLLLSSEEGDLFHFCWIKNLSGLIRHQCPNKFRKKFICNRCLHLFLSEEKLNAHKEDCKKLFKSAIILPTENNNELYFKNHRKFLRAPFVIYADCETILGRVNSEKATTTAFKQHDIHSIGYYLKCSYNDNFSRFNFTRSENCGSWFGNKLHDIAKQIKQVIKYKND